MDSREVEAGVEKVEEVVEPWGSARARGTLRGCKELVLELLRNERALGGSGRRERERARRQGRRGRSSSARFRVFTLLAEGVKSPPGI